MILDIWDVHAEYCIMLKVTINLHFPDFSLLLHRSNMSLIITDIKIDLRIWYEGHTGSIQMVKSIVNMQSLNAWHLKCISISSIPSKQLLVYCSDSCDLIYFKVQISMVRYCFRKLAKVVELCLSPSLEICKQSKILQVVGQRYLCKLKPSEKRFQTHSLLFLFDQL